MIPLLPIFLKQTTMLESPLLRKNEEAHFLTYRSLWCALLLIFFSFFCSVQLASQTIVKLMAEQAVQLQINLEEQQYFGDALQFTLGDETLISGGTSPYGYEWMHNSSLISTEASIVVTPLQNDVYTLIVTDSLECTAEKDILLKIAAGTNDLIKNDVTIYPNPARDYIHIIVPGDPLRFTGVLFNSLGMSVWRGEVSNNSIIPLHYPPGYYLLQLKNEQMILEKKIIIR